MEIWNMLGISQEQWTQILIDLAVNFISFLAAGGLIFELFRFSRERKQWKKQDQILAIDISKPKMMVKYYKKPTKGTKIEILERTNELLENGLLGTPSSFVIDGFVTLRNLTNSQINILDIDIEVIASKRREGPIEKQYRHYPPRHLELISAQRARKMRHQNGFEDFSLYSKDKKRLLDANQLFLLISGNETETLYFLYERQMIKNKNYVLPNRIKVEARLSNGKIRTEYAELGICEELVGVEFLDIGHFPSEFINEETTKQDISEEEKDEQEIPF